MNTPPGNGQVAGAPVAKLSIQQILDQPMSVSFAQESLEFAIETIVSECRRNLPGGTEMPAVRIEGSDLKQMGITQNQQVRDFDKVDVPLRTVLTDLVVAANPDRSAEGATDPKQSLVWVVTSNSDGKTPLILVTTRQASAEKYELPAEFVAER